MAVKFPPPGWAREFAESLISGVFADMARSVHHTLKIEPEEGEILEPFHQLDELCPNCYLRIYVSANGIPLCLVCGNRMDGVRVRRRARPKRAPKRVYKVRGEAQPQAERRERERERERERRRSTTAPPVRVLSESERAYLLLELDRNATVEDVKRRRRELAFRHHPDRGGNVGKLAEINEAADILIDYLDS